MHLVSFRLVLGRFLEMLFSMISIHPGSWSVSTTCETPGKHAINKPSRRTRWHRYSNYRLKKVTSPVSPHPDPSSSARFIGVKIPQFFTRNRQVCSAAGQRYIPLCTCPGSSSMSDICSSMSGAKRKVFRVLLW
jgi:hypothetical protein